jgi:hypothetical protein
MSLTTNLSMSNFVPQNTKTNEKYITVLLHLGEIHNKLLMT